MNLKKEDQEEQFEGLGYGPGVDPIPEADNGTASTDMLEGIVDEIINEPIENKQGDDNSQSQNNTQSTEK
ncbi:MULTISPECIES: hypothetical protein [Paenibacillus]|uniref:hypothetical protein n=1 Tax=Paenibacillus TaxID=44249 RepID=UPI002FE3FD87